MHSGHDWDSVTTKIMRTLALAQPEQVELLETKDGKALVVFLVSGNDEAIAKIREMFKGNE